MLKSKANNRSGISHINNIGGVALLRCAVKKSFELVKRIKTEGSVLEESMKENLKNLIFSLKKFDIFF